MKTAAMHTGNACTRLISILYMVVGCYSQTCNHIYSPILTGFTSNTQYNGIYTYLDQFGGADRYRDQNALFLFKPNLESPYIFSSTTATGYTMFGITDRAAGFTTNAGVTNAGGIGVTVNKRVYHVFFWEQAMFRD